MAIIEAASKALERPDAAWILAANAIPVIGVLFFGWQALPLLVFYWIENVVIGGFNAAKILIASMTRDTAQRWAGLFLVPFFAFHYGLFCFVHGVFVFAMFTMSDLIHTGVDPEPDSFELVPRVIGTLETDNGLFWGVVALMIVQSAAFAIVYVGGRRWLEVQPIQQMFEPYGRIVVLHMTIFIATIPVLALGQPFVAVLVLALLKSGLELGLPQFQVAAPDLSKTQLK